MEQGLRKELDIPWTKMTGVWWDLNTCPVPDGCDLGCFRPFIESALKKHADPVTIFAIGNLEVISPQVLKEISSYGILLRHSPYDEGAMLFDALCEWRERYPSPNKIMLISGSTSWCSHSFLRFGYTIFRAFPSTRPAWTYTTCEEWERVWEIILKENPRPPLETSEETVEPACFCRLCKFSSQSCDDFIKHLKSKEHALNPHNSVFWLASSQQLGSNNGGWFSFTLNEYDEPLLFCRRCKYCSYDLHNTIIHLYSEGHAQNELALSGPTATTIPRQGFNKNFYAGPQTTGVWWDLNTCPVPDGYDIRCVRPSIESALKKHFGTAPVTVFAIGNLDFFSPQVLKEISSSGILLTHSPFGGGLEVFNVLYEWKKHNPSPGKIMLISGNNSWYNNYLHFGYTILRAYPKHQQHEAYGSYKEWSWESLLQENFVAPPLETNSREILEQKCTDSGQPAFLCTLCDITKPNCDGFIKHLKGRKHKSELWDWVRVDENNEPEHFCYRCQYPCIDEYNMTFHRMSEGHIQQTCVWS